MNADDERRNALAAWLRKEIGTNPGTPLGRGYQATVHRYASPLGEVVVKRPHDTFPLRQLGLAALRREQKVYERLENVAGIPQSYGLVDDRYLVLEAIDGPSLRDHEPHLEDRERFFAHLFDTIAAMHAAGVAHGDLKRKDNVLVGSGERPYIIDFGVATLKKHPGAHLEQHAVRLVRTTRRERLGKTQVSKENERAFARGRRALPPAMARAHRPLDPHTLAETHPAPPPPALAATPQPERTPVTNAISRATTPTPQSVPESKRER